MDLVRQLGRDNQLEVLDPARLRHHGQLLGNALLSAWDRNLGNLVLSWAAVPGRVYTVWSGTNLLETFAPPTNGPAPAFPIQSSTNSVRTGEPLRIFRLRVTLP